MYSGLDPRYDGVPKQTERAAEAHFRILSHNKPRIYMEENFLSSDECDVLKNHAIEKMKHLSLQLSNPNEFVAPIVVNPNEIAHDAALASISKRVHQFTRLVNNEARLVIRKLGKEELGHDSRTQEYPYNPVTVMVFLDSVKDGGELIFPRAKPKMDACLEGDASTLENCCSQAGLKVPQQRGDAVLLYSHDMEGRFDPDTLHGICPAREEGVESWVAEWRFVFKPMDDPPVRSKKRREREQPSIVFHNKLDHEVRIFWVENALAHAATGTKEVRMGEIPAGERRPFNTFMGHVFHVRGPAGKLLQTAVVKDEETHIKITGQQTISKHEEL